MPMSDAKLFMLGQKHDELKAEIAELAAKCSHIDQQIIAELERRGTSKVTADDGYSVSKAQAEKVLHDDDGWMQWLARRPKLRSKVVKEVVDHSEIARQMQLGKIPETAVARYTSTQKNAPYVTTAKDSR